MSSRKLFLNQLQSSRLVDLSILLKRALRLNSIDRNKFFPDLPLEEEVNRLQELVFSVRDENYRPSIIIHGIMPRSGTNYLSNLLELHGDLAPHPQRIWEFPLLTVTDRCQLLQKEFVAIYARNEEVLLKHQFAALLMSSFMNYLQRLSGPDKTMLLKVPHVEFIELFRIFFPRDYLLLVLRDGRDVVASSLKTFKKGILQKSFPDYCHEWTYAAQSILRIEKLNDPRIMIIRFEDILSNPHDGISEILKVVGLEESGFQFDKLETTPVIGSSELSQGEVNWLPQKRPPEFNPIGRWEHWSEKQKRRFKKIAGQTLIECGYEKNNHW